MIYMSYIKVSWTSNRPKILIFEKNQGVDSLYFESFLCVSNNPLLLQKKSTSKGLYIKKIKGPFVKLIIFNEALQL
jgi:hypothetical protein